MTQVSPQHPLNADRLRELDRLLTNLQPHIPQACKDGHSGFIDSYVDPAIEIVRDLIAALSPKEEAGE